MRHLVKEELLRFDGTRLFPERRSYTVQYPLTDAERALYVAVTDYVRDQMNLAQRLENDGRKRVAVGFALTTLQRRLASSPAAIHKSLDRRLKRLESELREARLGVRVDRATVNLEDLTDVDLDDLTDEERERLEDEVAAAASAAPRFIAHDQLDDCWPLCLY